MCPFLFGLILTDDLFSLWKFIATWLPIQFPFLSCQPLCETSREFQLGKWQSPGTATRDMDLWHGDYSEWWNLVVMTSLLCSTRPNVLNHQNRRQLPVGLSVSFVNGLFQKEACQHPGQTFAGRIPSSSTSVPSNAPKSVISNRVQTSLFSGPNRPLMLSMSIDFLSPDIVHSNSPT